MKTLVISAVNFTEGGPLTVLHDCVTAAVKFLPDWRIVVMVHDLGLLDTEGVEIMTFPKVKGSWIRRLALEWFEFGNLAESLNVDLWISLHDITPRVKARRQAVYCHNPAPFSRATVRDTFFEPKFLAFSLLYGYVYSTNIHKNYAVIVQQDWLRDEFIRRYDINKVIVAHPESSIPLLASLPAGQSLKSCKNFIFLYPALPRCFKNFEVVGFALEILEKSSDWSGVVRWTIDGTENRYTRWLHSRFGKLRSLQWIGHQNRTQMHEQYSQVDCLIFPSRAETWGLPITEAKQAKLPLLVADLPYARETVGTWDKVAFFPAQDPHALALSMNTIINGPSAFQKVQALPVPQPSASSWSELLKLLTYDL